MYSVINNGPSPKKELVVLDKHCYCCLAAEEQLCSHIALCLNSKGEPCSPVLPFTPLCFVTIVLENNRPCQRAVRVPINSTVPATSVKIELFPQTPAYRLLSPCWGCASAEPLCHPQRCFPLLLAALTKRLSETVHELMRSQLAQRLVIRVFK